MKIAILILGMLLSGLAESQVITTPVLHYPLDNSGIDSMMTGNNLVKYGSITYDATNKAVGSHSASIPKSGRFSIPTPVNLGTEITVSMWIRLTEAPVTTYYLMATADPDDYFGILINASSQLRAYTGAQYAGSSIISTNEFHHIAIILNKNTGYARFYRDGVKQTLADSSINTSFNSNDSIYLGTSNIRINSWKGNIDEVLIFDSELETWEVEAIYNKTWSYSEPSIASSDNTLLNYIVSYAPRINPYTIYPYTYNKLAHDQNFLTHSYASVNDYVGVIRPSAQWDTLSAFSYELIEDTSGLFSITDNIISFQSVTGLQTSKAYHIRYSVNDSIYADTASGYIYIADADSCFYIDPAGTGDATSWTTYDNNFTSGYYYLQKRGSYIATTAAIDINKSNVTIGAYGSGAYPRVRYTPTDIIATFYCVGHEDLTVRDIQIENYAYDAVRITDFDNVYPQKTILDNLIITDARISLFARGENLIIRNCLIYDMMSDGILINGVDSIEIANTAIWDVNNHYNDDGVPKAAGAAYWGDGIQIEPIDEAWDGYAGYYSNDPAWIHHVYINKNDTNKSCLLYGSASGYGKLILEHCRFIGNPDPNKLVKIFYCNGGQVNNDLQDSIIMRYNIFENAEMFYQHSAGTRYEEYSYNTFRNMGSMGYWIRPIDSVKFFNNTIYNVGGYNGDLFYISSSSNDAKFKLRNNIIYLNSDIDIKTATYGTLSSDYNIYYPNAINMDITLGANDIEGDPLINSTTLRPTALSPGVGAGVNLGFIYDLFFNLVSDPDIGAYEYVP